LKKLLPKKHLLKELRLKRRKKTKVFLLAGLSQQFL
jgi:hypothetical protein